MTVTLRRLVEAVRWIASHGCAAPTIGRALFSALTAHIRPTVGATRVRNVLLVAVVEDDRGNNRYRAGGDEDRTGASLSFLGAFELAADFGESLPRGVERRGRRVRVG